jgi:demethylmenaquinone methyltransferase/2-methoxy-6-polyprenyl-1,4-benzoquinol methylase
MTNPVKTAATRGLASNLPEYFASEDERVRFVRKMFDGTAADYDRMERLLSFGSGSWYRREALRRAGLVLGNRVLDVAVGTGLVAREAARIVGDPQLVTGVDPSAAMMGSAALPAGVHLVEGRAEALPLADGMFDFLSMGYALRHLADLPLAFSEFYRVLKPGARLCILEITRPRNRVTTAILKGYMHGVVPALGRLFAKSSETAPLWRYYWDTIEASAPPEEVIGALRGAGFTEARRPVSCGMFSEYQATKPA